MKNHKMPKGIVLLTLLAACAGGSPTPSTPAAGAGNAYDPVARRYVALILAVGQHDAAYVDAYYGPPEWQQAAEAAGKRPLPELRAEAEALIVAARAVDTTAADEMVRLRGRYLTRQLEAAHARIRMLSGERLSFDEESRALYDAVAPRHTEADFQAALDDLDRLLPGDGPLLQRLDAFRGDFVIPREKLDVVFRAAIAEARRRTIQHIQLPANESFELEYVTDKSWSGYNWYRGNGNSLIQINVDLPIYIDRAIDLAAHEGYPGHHVYNVLLEHHLARGRGWVEFMVYPLFSPQSLVAEGSANYGIAVAFPGEERIRFERAALWPLAGLDPARAEQYYAVQDVLGRLSYAGNEAARRYLNGEIDAAQAAAWLQRYALSSPERARQRVRFFDDYRSYVINYNLGQDLVRAYVERRAAGDDARRWRVFAELLSSPRLPSDLR